MGGAAAMLLCAGSHFNDDDKDSGTGSVNLDYDNQRPLVADKRTKNGAKLMAEAAAQS